VNKQTFRKRDGRHLHLYSRGPIRADLDPDGLAPVPTARPAGMNAHFRWHPFRGEWVAYASHRQDRTFLPPSSYNPLAPEVPGGLATELPSGDYEVAVFENLFPTMTSREASPPPEGMYLPIRQTAGQCEVVVFTQDPEGSLSSIPREHLELILQVWAERTSELGARRDIVYVMPFENRGVEVGVTLHHPHGQIYAYPFVPPLPRAALAEQKRHLEETGRGLMSHVLEREIVDGSRILYAGADALAFVPAFARYSYEVWIAPRRPVAYLADLRDRELRDLARALKTVLLKYDGLWQRPFPYVMAVHQAPTDGEAHPEAHLNIQFFPPLRTRERLKFLAGTELAAGMFASDSLPEEKARELQSVSISLD